MSRNLNSRAKPQVLETDEDALLALKTFTGYQPSNPVYTIATLTMKYDAMRAAQETEITAQNALSAARDAAVLAEWDFHDFLIGIKDQVIAQYGPDSDEVAALGLKKKSARKTRSRSTPTSPTA
jgi:hypothetical protein